MIRPLRHRHRSHAIVLGILLPIVFVLGIAARKPAPMMGELPQPLAPTSPRFPTCGWNSDDSFPKSRVSIRLWCQQNGSGPFAVSFYPDANFIKPDLMVYWMPGSPGSIEALPTNAILLGAFGPAPFPLSDQVSSADGELALYSLADGEIVDVSKIVRLDNGRQPETK